MEGAVPAKICVVITLGVRNALNSADWNFIRKCPLTIGIPEKGRSYMTYGYGSKEYIVSLMYNYGKHLEDADLYLRSNQFY